MGRMISTSTQQSSNISLEKWVIGNINLYIRQAEFDTQIPEFDTQILKFDTQIPEFDTWIRQESKLAPLSNT